MSTKALVFSILDTPAVGGAEMYLLSNLVYLNQRGYPILLATNCPVVQALIKTLPVGTTPSFTIVDLPIKLDAIGNWKGLVKFFLSLPKASKWLMGLKKLYFDSAPKVTCLLPGFSDRLFFSHWVKKWGYRLLWLEYGPLEPSFKKNWGFPKLLYYVARRLPDVVITISEWTKKSLIETADIDLDHIRLVYPGVPAISSSQQSTYQKQGRQWRQQHGLSKQNIICGVGRIATEKEFELLVQAFAQLLSQPTQAASHLVIIGEGPQTHKLQQLIERLNLEKHVTLTGFVKEQLKYAILATSQVFVFPSAWPLEGFGMTTIEAMHLGLPVITTGFGPQAEIVKHNQTGLRFKPSDSHDLYLKIRTLLSESELRQKLAQAGRTKARSLFAAETMHRQIEDLI